MTTWTLKDRIQLRCDQYNNAMKHLFPKDDSGSGCHIDTDPCNVEGMFGDEATLVIPTDIIVTYDVVEDEMSDIERDIANALLQNFFTECHQFANTICDADGSGNRLVYGGFALRER